MTDKDQVARNILSDITVHMKYARYLPEKERRENMGRDCLIENKEMHQKKIPRAKQVRLLRLMKLVSC